MTGERPYLAYVSIVLGVLIGFIIPMLFKQMLDETVIVALSVTGGVTFFGGIWYGDLWKNRENRDDRLVKIHHRAAWNGFWAVVVILGTSIFVLENTT